MKLTAKQELFVKEYLIHKNATRAAIAAGYSEQTAQSMGSENLRKPVIAQAIAEGMSLQIKSAEARAAKRGITKDRWLKELELLAFANMDDFATVSENDRVSLIPTAERKKLRGHVIKKLTETQTQHGGSTGIELHNKLPALELIAKHYGWIKDQVETSGPGGGPQVVLQIYQNGSEAPPEDKK